MSALLVRFRPGGIGRHISWLLFQSGVEAATMTLAALLAARWFGPVAWGQLGILLAGVQLISMIGDGFFPTVVKFVSEARADEYSRPELVGWRCMWWTMAALSVTAILLGAAALLVFSDRIALWWVGLAVLLAVGRGWRATFDGIYRGLQNFRTPAIAGSITIALTAVVLISCAWAGYRISVYLGVMLIGILANCLWLWIAFNMRYLTNEHRERHLAKSASTVSFGSFYRYSLPLAARGLLGFLFLKINIWILGAIASEYDAGQFRLTDQFLTIPSLLISSVLAAVAPRIVTANLAGKAQLELLLSRVYGLMLVLSVPMAVFFWWNEPIVILLFPEYGMASQMLAYFAPAMAMMGIGFAASIVPVQAGRPKLALWVTIVGSVSNVLAALIGLRIAGVHGMAVASALVHFLTYLLGVIVTHWAFGLRFTVRFG